MENMNVVNLTPHAIKLLAPDEGGEPIVIPPSGRVARVASNSVVVGSVVVGGLTIPVTTTEFGEVEGLPDPQPNTIFVVSGMVAAQVQRRDVFSPGDQVRNSEGLVVGCKTLNQPKPNN